MTKEMITNAIVFMPTTHVESWLVEHRAYLGNVANFNDPLEGCYFPPEYHKWMLEEKGKDPTTIRDSDLKRASLTSAIKARRSFYVLCGSDPSILNSKKVELMWAHYADGHKGVALHIEVPLNLTPVKYEPWNKSHGPIENYTSIFYKSSAWGYEKELRGGYNEKGFEILRGFDDITSAEIYSSPKKASIKFRDPIVKKVYLGLKLSEEDESKITALAIAINAQLFQAEINIETTRITYTSIR